MHQNSFPRWLIAALALVLLVLLAGGAWFYRTQEQQLRQQAEENLQAVAQLKANQIATWRADQLTDTAVFSENPFLIEGVARWLADPQAQRSEEILAWFWFLQEHYHYDDVRLVDADGQVLLSLSGRLDPLPENEAQALTTAWQHDRKPVMTDLYAGSGNLPPHIDVIGPLFASSEPAAEPVGAVIVQIDASQFLYPLIQSWPIPSGSAETLLVRRDGDTVLFLNELRHQTGTALTLRIPLSQTDVPAVKAVLGTEGIFQGKDYRGVEVLSALQAVPDSPWFVVSKVDTTEVFADWRTRSIIILALLLGLVAAVGTTGGVVWQRRQKVYYRTLLQAEKTRQEAETRYHTTLLSIGDGVIVTDSEGQIVLLNPVAEALTGWSQGEARGKPLEEVFRIINEETRQPVENQLRPVLRENINVGLANNTLLIAEDGRGIPIADSGAPVCDAGGKLTGMVLVFRDQTEERAAQKALRESHEKLALLFEILPVGVSILDQDRKLIIQNPALEKMLDISHDGLLRGDYRNRKYLRVDGTPMPVEEFASTRVINGEAVVHNAEIGVVKENGALVWTSVSATACPHMDWKVVIVTTDITDRKRIEETLRQSEQQYRTLFDQSINALLVCEAVVDEQGTPTDFVLLQINRAFEDSVNLPSQEIVGRHLTHVLPDIKDTPLFNAMIRAEATRQPDQLEFYSVSLSRYWDVGVFSPRQGQVAITYTDITARKQVEEHKARLALEQEKARILRDFIEGVSHEFRTPLAVIHSRLDLLERTGTQPLARSSERIAQSKEETMYISGLVDTMLTITRLDSVSSLPATATAINAVVAQVAETFQPYAAKHEVVLRLETLEGSSVVSGDPDELEHAVGHLVKNAIQFTPPNGIVTLRTFADSHHAIIEVSDTGTGISEEALPFIFERFYRADTARTGRHAGLGLAVTKRIIELHAGQIEVTSQLNEGSTFRVLLPLANEPDSSSED